MSQKEIADILEVSQTIYGKWESDRFYPTYKNLKKIAAFYMIEVKLLTDDQSNLSLEKSSDSFKSMSLSKSSKTILKLLKKIEKAVSLIREQAEISQKQKDD